VWILVDSVLCIPTQNEGQEAMSDCSSKIMHATVSQFSGGRC